MITGTMRQPAAGVLLEFVVQEGPDGEMGVILYIGGRRAFRLDAGEQQEFLGHFRAAQRAAVQVQAELRGTRGH